MKNLIQILFLTLTLLGSLSTASYSYADGSPMPLCDPKDPKCKILVRYTDGGPVPLCDPSDPKCKILVR